MNRYFKVSILVLAALLILSVKPAYAAYIDPNTGGMLFQMLAIIFGVISGIILIFSSRIKMMYFRISRYLRGSDDEASNEDNAIEE